MSQAVHLVMGFCISASLLLVHTYVQHHESSRPVGRAIADNQPKESHVPSSFEMKRKSLKYLIYSLTMYRGVKDSFPAVNYTTDGYGCSMSEHTHTLLTNDGGIERDILLLFMMLMSP